MSALKRPVAALIGVMAVLLAGLFFSSSSQAAPYVSGVAPTTTISSTACGSPVTISGTGYQPGETVTVTENGTVLGKFGPVDSNGSFSGTITVVCPSGTDAVTIISTGSATGAVDAITIHSTAGGGSGGGSGNGGLSNTGVAVIGIGALGVVLLVGGGLLLLAGKRRKVSI